MTLIKGSFINRSEQWELFYNDTFKLWKWNLVMMTYLNYESGQKGRIGKGPNNIGWNTWQIHIVPKHLNIAGEKHPRYWSGIGNQKLPPMAMLQFSLGKKGLRFYSEEYTRQLTQDAKYFRNWKLNFTSAYFLLMHFANKWLYSWGQTTCKPFPYRMFWHGLQNKDLDLLEYMISWIFELMHFNTILLQCTIG